MDLNIILAIITLLLLIIMGLVLYKYPFTVKPENNNKKRDVAPDDQGEARVGAGARNQRARMRANAARQRNDIVPDDDNHDGNQDADEEAERLNFQGDGKMGAKKRAKLEAKAEKKAAREAEEHMREERKAKEAQKDEERKKQEDMDRAEELKRLEDEKRETEERERREQEEYLKMKAAFSVEGEGYDEEDDNENERNLLQEFISYIKSNKVVIIEDLAAHFKLKTQAAIDRITTLQADGTLTGVVDDRGKFIYISQQELENVAKFIKQRGRVSITDLVESSNQLINLVPVTVQN